MIPSVGTYAFTVTMMPRYYDFGVMTQYKYLVTAFNESLQNPCRNNKGITITYARCELTKACNIHMHGVVMIEAESYVEAKVRWHKLFRRHRVVGFVNLTIMDDAEGWYDYVMKDQEDFEKVVPFLYQQRHPIHTLETFPPVVADQPADEEARVRAYSEEADGEHDDDPIDAPVPPQGEQKKGEGGAPGISNLLLLLD